MSLLITAASLAAAVRSSGGRNWCRLCGGVNACYPDCPSKQPRPPKK